MVKRLPGVDNNLMLSPILNLTYSPNALWASLNLFPPILPQMITFSLYAQLREALKDKKKKKLLRTKGEPEGAGLGQASRWWSQQAVMWDGQSLVPASSLLCTRQLSRGCFLLTGGELRDTHLFFHLHLPASDRCWAASTAWWLPGVGTRSQCQWQSPLAFLAALPEHRLAGERHGVCRFLCSCASTESLGVKWGKRWL